MESEVFVMPQELLGSICADLYVGLSTNGGYTFEEITHPNEPGTQIRVYFSLPTPLLETGWIHVDVTGERKTNNVQAMHSAVKAVLQALRANYGLFITNYNYIVICEKRKHLLKMRDASSTMIDGYENLEESIDNIMQILQAGISDLEDLLAQNKNEANQKVMEPMKLLHKWLFTYIPSVKKSCKQATNVMWPIKGQQGSTESIYRLSNTQNTDKETILQRSFYTLKAVFAAAMEKLNNVVPDFQVYILEDGHYQCKIDVNFPPKNFTGEPASTHAQAKINLVIHTLNFLDTNIGLKIIDSTYFERALMDNLIEHFDHRMELMIWRCGLRLNKLAPNCLEAYDMMLTEVLKEVRCFDMFTDIIHKLHGHKMSLAAAAEECNALWENFRKCKVTRASLELAE